MRTSSTLALIAKLSAEESALVGARILAPCVPGGRVRAMVGGIPHTLTPREREFEGWGIFRAIDHRWAELLEIADLPAIDAYLALFPRLRLRLARRLRGATWLACPMGEGDVRLAGTPGPLPLHLVTDGGAFEGVVARYDGTSCWFDQVDRRADPAIADELRTSAASGVTASGLRLPGITPEDRLAYAIGCGEEGYGMGDRSARGDERRLRQALESGGGSLRQYHDRGDFWLVEWRAADGEEHSSAIRKRDLTVIGAGICLSGRDRDFDLRSLVGVIRDRPDWMR